jgi:hypothetical protein
MQYFSRRKARTPAGRAARKEEQGHSKEMLK